MQRRILITGAQGLVGRYLASRILDLEEGAQVLGIGRSAALDGLFTHSISTSRGPSPAPLPASLLGSFDARYRYRQVSLLDTTSLRELIREFQPHCVFHLASALSSASEHELFETNVQGTVSLMEALAAGPEPKPLVILGSSGSVYGEPLSLPISESALCEPADLYGVTKLAAEHIARIHAGRSRLAVITARIFNVVGPGQAESHVCGRFAAQLAALAGGGGEVLEVGQLATTRDFIDVRDIAAGLLLLADKGEAGRAYNLASGRETAIQTILSELLRVSGLEGQVQIAQRSAQPGGVGRHFAEVSRLRELGFVVRYSIRESLEDVFRYYQGLRR